MPPPPAGSAHPAHPNPPWPRSRMAPCPSTPGSWPHGPIALSADFQGPRAPLRPPRPWAPLTPWSCSSWPQGPWSHDPMPLDPGPIALSADLKGRHTCPPAPLFVVGGGCASSRLRFSLGTRGASISSISGSGKGFGRQDFEGCWHNSITWHSTCAHTRARARARARASNVQLLAEQGADDHAHEHLHGVCERENCTCTLPQCGHAPPRCF